MLSSVVKMRERQGFYFEAKLVEHQLEASLTYGMVKGRCLYHLVGPMRTLSFSEAMFHLWYQGQRLY